VQFVSLLLLFAPLLCVLKCLIKLRVKCHPYMKTILKITVLAVLTVGISSHCYALQLVQGVFYDPPQHRAQNRAFDIRAADKQIE